MCCVAGLGGWRVGACGRACGVVARWGGLREGGVVCGIRVCSGLCVFLCGVCACAVCVWGGGGACRGCGCGGRGCRSGAGRGCVKYGYLVRAAWRCVGERDAAGGRGACVACSVLGVFWVWFACSWCRGCAWVCSGRVVLGVCGGGVGGGGARAQVLAAVGGVCGYLTHICGRAARAAAGAWCWWRGAWVATQRQGRRSAGQRRGVLCSAVCVRHCVCVSVFCVAPLGGGVGRVGAGRCCWRWSGDGGAVVPYVTHILACSVGRCGRV